LASFEKVSLKYQLEKYHFKMELCEKFIILKLSLILPVLKNVFLNHFEKYLFDVPLDNVSFEVSVIMSFRNVSKCCTSSVILKCHFKISIKLSSFGEWAHVKGVR
jgi:hypothetical protein